MNGALDASWQNVGCHIMFDLEKSALVNCISSASNSASIRKPVQVSQVL
jgi:hypothetical protein